MSSDGKNGYAIADANTEEMWIDEDGKVFIYYAAGPRYIDYGGCLSQIAIVCTCVCVCLCV